MSLISVDETAGSDTTGQGSLEKPYQSLAQAIYANPQAQDSQFRIRKTADAEYEEPTLSSLKKAKKNAQGIEKKRKKEEEQAERDAKKQGEEKEKRENLLEESKKIVIEDDPALPTATRVSLATCFLPHIAEMRYYRLKSHT
jgi:asparaginyl-tRNA synthetase